MSFTLQSDDFRAMPGSNILEFFLGGDLPPSCRQTSWYSKRIVIMSYSEGRESTRSVTISSSRKTTKVWPDLSSDMSRKTQPRSRHRTVPSCVETGQGVPDQPHKKDDECGFWVVALTHHPLVSTWSARFLDIILAILACGCGCEVDDLGESAGRSRGD